MIKLFGFAPFGSFPFIYTQNNGRLLIDCLSKGSWQDIIRPPADSMNHCVAQWEFIESVSASTVHTDIMHMSACVPVCLRELIGSRLMSTGFPSAVLRMISPTCFVLNRDELVDRAEGKTSGSKSVIMSGVFECFHFQGWLSVYIS